jgi:hypothetical protein
MCRWRAKLALHLQRRYCSGAAFFHVGSQQAWQPWADWRVRHTAFAPAASRGALPSAPCPPDSPDQRLTADVAALCDTLAATARVAAAAPFKLSYFSWLAWSYVGWRGLVAVYAFFLAAAAVQRYVPLV